MKKVLIIGTWNQWKKYFSFLKSFFWDTYQISLVNKSGIDKNNFFKQNIKKYNNIKNNVSYIKNFDLIILAVKEKAQTNIIFDLLKKNINDIKIIIEKPVSYNLNLINKLVNKENYFFFIDETYLYNINSNTLKNMLESNLYLTIPKQADIIQHAFWLFLNEKKIFKIKNNCIFNFTNKVEDYIYYKIKDKSQNKIINYKWDFFISTKEYKYLSYLDFYKSINNLLKLNNNENNKVIKKNFLELNHFILYNLFKY